MSENHNDDPRKPRHFSAMESWTGKLALTIVVGGAFSLWTYWRFSSIFNVADGLFGVPIGLRHFLTVAFWAVLIATALCLFERKGWHESIIKGVLISVAASLFIMTTFVLIMLLGGMFVGHMLH